MTEKYKHITAAVLAGGKSLRMKSDKATLKFNNVTFLEYIISLLKRIFNDIVIISDYHQDYRYLNIPIYEDIYKHSGPLGGIHSAFINTNSDSLFIVTCDNPLIDVRGIKYLVDYNSSSDVLVYSHQEKINPLFGIYRRSCLPLIIERIEQNQLSVLEFLKAVKTEYIDPTNLGIDIENAFRNINTQTEYKSFIEKYEHR